MSTHTCGTDVKARTCAGCHVLTLGRLSSADEAFSGPVRVKNSKPAVPKLSCLKGCSRAHWRWGGPWFAGRRPSNLEELQLKRWIYYDNIGGRFWTELCLFKIHILKAEEPETKLPTSSGSSKKQDSSRKTSISALLTMPKPVTVWITINCGKFWKRWEYQTTWPASWETCMQVRKQQLELDMERQTGSK